MTLYRGFSFKNWQRTKSFVLTDIELVKQDITNHIFTLRGTRIGSPNFGTDIEILKFRPMDQLTITAIADQVREVIDFDPRVEIRDESGFVVTPDFNNSSVLISVRLFYIELNLEDTLSLNLEFENP
jgi:phage baseplate assembly protein W